MSLNSTGGLSHQKGQVSCCYAQSHSKALNLALQRLQFSPSASPTSSTSAVASNLFHFFSLSLPSHRLNLVGLSPVQSSSQENFTSLSVSCLELCSAPFFQLQSVPLSLMFQLLCLFLSHTHPYTLFSNGQSGGHSFTHRIKHHHQDSASTSSLIFFTPTCLFNSTFGLCVASFDRDDSSRNRPMQKHEIITHFKAFLVLSSGRHSVKSIAQHQMGSISILFTH